MRANTIPLGFSLLLLATTATAQERVPVDVGTVHFDGKTGTVTLRAEGRSLSSLLEQLAREHGVRVDVVDFHDREVDVDIEGRPLTAALAELLGEGVRYRLSLAEDRELPAPPSARQELRPDAAAPATTRRMDIDPPVPVAGARVMPAVERAQGDRPAAGERTMADPFAIPAVSELEPRLDAVDAAEQVGAASGRHVVVLLRLRRNGPPVVERIVEQPGAAVSNPRLVGSCLYEVRVGDDLFAVGSMQDPLRTHPVCTERPADPRRRLVRTEDDEAVVSLTLDGSLLDPAKLFRATIRLHRLRDAADLPGEVTTETFDRFRASCDELCTVETRLLRTARIDRR